MYTSDRMIMIKRGLALANHSVLVVVTIVYLLYARIQLRYRTGQTDILYKYKTIEYYDDINPFENIHM